MVGEQGGRSIENWGPLVILLIFFNIVIGYLYFKRNAFQSFIMFILIVNMFIAVRFSQMKNIKLVIIDLKERFYMYSFCGFAGLGNIIAYARMLKELQGAIEKNMSMKSDFELILQSL